MSSSDLKTRLDKVKSRIADAARRSGRESDEITLIAVTKTRTAEEIQEAVGYGVLDIGENYVQEAVGKYETLDSIAKWHMIGHLQRNKVKQVVRFADLIHSVDSAGLAAEIGKRSVEIGKTSDILLEVNLTEESAKFGASDETVLKVAEEVGNISGIRICGLMGMAHMTSDSEETRPYFRKLRMLFEKLPKEQQIYLSMGMTQDYEIAIEEGSNMVRIGTAIFGPRK